jgi:hypothetical protein
LERERSTFLFIIAIQLGLNVTLATGAVAYLAALLLTTTLRPVHQFKKCVRRTCRKVEDYGKEKGAFGARLS